MLRKIFSSTIRSQSFRRPYWSDRAAKGLVVGMYEKETAIDKPTMTAGAARFDETHDGALTKLIGASDQTGRIGQELTFTNMGTEFNAVAVVGLGPRGIGHSEIESIDCDRENVRVASAIGCRTLEAKGCTQIFVDSMDYPEQAAEGSALAMWKFQDNVQLEKKLPTPTIELFDECDAEAWQKGLIQAEAQNIVRKLCDTPANQSTPSLFAQAAVDLLCPLGVTVEIRNLNWIESNNMSCFLAAAKSSCEPPILLELSYCGAGTADEAPVLLIGEGQTFNSGGLSLKKSDGMLEYRASMAGAACVVAAIQAAAALALKVRVIGIIPLCENMPSGMAMRPGDVINCKTGKSVVVHDANEAGVLMLIDALTYGQTVFNPRVTVDVATVTDDIKRALGGAAAGVFTDSPCLWSEIERAGCISGDRMWRMPLWKYFSEKVTDYEKYDSSNHGHGAGQACKAAALLKEHLHVSSTEWMHMDVRGVGMLCNNRIYPYLEPGHMTGRPTRALIQFLSQMCNK